MSNVVPFTLFTFDRLEFKAPPADIFEDLFGYEGEQRFIGFCYTGQALCIEDGQFDLIGNARPWSVWYRSLGVSVLRYYCFGYQGRAPEHLLILDRKSRALYAAPVQAGQNALAQQVRLQIQKTTATLSGVNSKNVDFAEMIFDFTQGENEEIQTMERMKKLENWLR